MPVRRGEVLELRDFTIRRLSAVFACFAKMARMSPVRSRTFDSGEALFEVPHLGPGEVVIEDERRRILRFERRLDLSPTLPSPMSVARG